MIKVRRDGKSTDIEIKVKFKDEDGFEVTEHDETYERHVKSVLYFLGMMMSCGDEVNGMSEDLQTAAIRSMNRSVATGFVPTKELQDRIGDEAWKALMGE